MDAPTDCDGVERDLFVSPDQFADQLADLAGRGFQSVRLDQFCGATGKSVLITFDDAYAHVASVVTPILRKFNFTAVMFAPAAYLGRQNEWDAGKHPRLAALKIASTEETRAMADGPWEIASHGWEHVDLRGLHIERRGDLVRARIRLSQIAGRPVEALAYPFGLSNEAVRDDARKAGYKMGFGVGPGSSGDPYQLPRHQISGRDNLAVFRLKTSGWIDRLYRVRRLTPSWARAGVRNVVGGFAGR